MVMVLFLLIFRKRDVLEWLSTKDAMARENRYMLWTTAGGITSEAEPIFDDTTFVYSAGTGARAISSGFAHAPCFPGYHLCLRNQGWVVSTAAKHSAQRAVSAVCCHVGCALVPSDCCAVVPGEQRC